VIEGVNRDWKNYFVSMNLIQREGNYAIRSRYRRYGNRC